MKRMNFLQFLKQKGQGFSGFLQLVERWEISSFRGNGALYNAEISSDITATKQWEIYG